MDYTRDAILEDLVELEIQQKAEVMEMMRESEYLQACYENQVVGLMEAQGDGAIANIVRATQAMFARVTKFFRRAAVHKFEKRFNKESLKKIRANLDKVKENANKLETQKMTPYWNADYNRDKSNIASAMKSAFSNVENGKYDDYGFASKFIKNTNLVKDRDTDVRNYLLNYFRYNNNDMLNPEAVNVAGKDIAGHIEEMLNYIENFPSSISALPGQVSDAYNTEVKKIKSIVDQVSKPVTQKEINADANGEKVTVDNDNNGGDTGTKALPAPNTESVVYKHITPNTYFSIENKFACETMLPFFIGYPVTEAGEQDGKDNVSPVAIQSADKDKGTNADTNKTKDTNGDNAKDADAQRKQYFNNANSFIKLALTSYQTAIEERFVVYSKLIYMIAKEFINVPKEQVDKATKAEAELSKQNGIGGKGK